MQIKTLLNEFNFIQSQFDEVKYQIQTSASSTSPENASPRVGATALPQDENLTVEEKKELEKKVSKQTCQENNGSIKKSKRFFGFHS